MDERVALRLGTVSATLFAIGNSIWAFGWPLPGADQATIAAFYDSRQVRIEVGGALSAVALALFVPFAAAVAWRIAERSPIRAVTAGFGAAILVLSGLGAETINLAGAVRGAHDPALARVLYEIPQVLGSYTAGIGLGIFAITTGMTRVLPRDWSAIVIVIGAVMLTPASLFVREFAGGGFIVITLVVAITMRPDPQ